MKKINQEIQKLIHHFHFDEDVFVDYSDEEMRQHNEMLMKSGLAPTAEQIQEKVRRIPTKEELEMFCMLRQTKSLESIKACVIFFTVLTIISIVGQIILLILIFILCSML